MKMQLNSLFQPNTLYYFSRNSIYVATEDIWNAKGGTVSWMKTRNRLRHFLRSEWWEFENEQHVAAPSFFLSLLLHYRRRVAIVDLLETSHYLFQRARRASIFQLPDATREHSSSPVSLNRILILYGPRRKMTEVLTSELNIWLRVHI